ncbi:MAG: TIM barrel protein [Anaerolineae bacterium]|nr:TIM barrel protein [Anaerolineae bacterium]
MGKIKQSVPWWCYENLGITPEDFVKMLTEIGYQGVEMFPPEHFHLAKDNGLQIVNTQAHVPLEVGLNKRENLPDIEYQLKERLGWCQQWHIPSLIVFSGNRDGQSDADGLDVTVENLKKLVPLAEAANVMLVLELLNSKVDHPDFMCDKTPWGVEVCRQVNSPNLKLLYDIYHMQIMEGDIISTINTYHEYIGHYHTAGVPGRNEIDHNQELNYAAILRAIAETGYEGFVGQEFIPKGDPKAGLEAAFYICDIS